MWKETQFSSSFSVFDAPDAETIIFVYPVHRSNGIAVVNTQVPCFIIVWLSWWPERCKVGDRGKSTFEIADSGRKGSESIAVDSSDVWCFPVLCSLFLKLPAYCQGIS